jgi:hypothetical protein
VVRRADGKVNAVVKRLEKSGRPPERAGADRPVGELGTAPESITRTTGTLPPPGPWSSVVSTPMPGAANPPAPSSIPQSAAGRNPGHSRPSRRTIVGSIFLACGLVVAGLWLPRWLSAR